MSRVPSPPPPAEMSSGPVAESWCYTQVSLHCAEIFLEVTRLEPVVRNLFKTSLESEFSDDAMLANNGHSPRQQQNVTLCPWRNFGGGSWRSWSGPAATASRFQTLLSCAWVLFVTQVTQ